MSLIQIIVILIVAGIVIFGINKIPFIDGTMKQIIKWVIIAAVIFFLFKAFHLLSYLSSLHV